MPDFGIFRGFNEKLFGDKLVAGQLPTQLGLIGSEDAASLLLDFYPNAAAAYSLRKLRAAYTGSAIRVRRASDNTEQDIGFVNNELDTSTLTTFCSGTNGFVKTWYDQSGNGRDATQTTAANQPQIYDSSTGVNTLNSGKPALFYSALKSLVSTANLSTPYTLFTVFEKLSGPKFNVAASGYPYISYNEDSVRYRIYDMSTIYQVVVTSVDGQDVLRTDVFDYDTPEGVIRLNGDSYAINPARNWSASGIILGRGSGDGSDHLTEVILYSSNQSLAGNLSGIESNINDFYSIS